jgi:hypothetical protein
MRGAGSESEPAPRGQRPEQLPRDPSYEAELAQVGLAVMRDRARRDDPSTKQGGGRRSHELPTGTPPESITPESPGTRVTRDVASARSPEPPSSGGRAVASGTLLSVGAVDPRGKTERTLETPRMFFSQPDRGAEAYFKPGKIPAVTVHQTIETETVKLSDSVDPRRAKTIPRLDRAELARLADSYEQADSPAPVARSAPASDFEPPVSAAPVAWNERDYDPASSLGDDEPAGQIHASLSPFREQGEPSFSLEGVATRPEPYVARLQSEPPLTPPMSDPSAVPTQRDLPQHRVEASRPPPASLPRPASDSAVPSSEMVSPTTASIAAEEPVRRPSWLNYVAFLAALLVAVLLGLWLTGGSPPQQTRQKSPEPERSAALVVAKPTPPPVSRPAPEQLTHQAPMPTPQVTAEPVAAPAPRKLDANASPKAKAPVVAPKGPQSAGPHKSTPPKTSRETIF